MDLSCLANNRKSFFVSFHSSSCRYAENFKSFPLLSFTSFIHFWKLYIPNLCLCLDSICPQLPSEDAGRITPIFYQNPTGLLSRIRYVKSILLSSHPLDVSGSLHRQNSPRSLNAELPVVHTFLQTGASSPGTAPIQDPLSSPRPAAHRSCILS